MRSVGLFVMGEKGLACVKALSAASIKVAYIVGARDTSIEKDYFDEIRSEAEFKGYSFFERKDFSDSRKADINFAISWRWMIAETESLVVFHDSLLPKYRGFNPLVTALIQGDEEIGVTAIKANSEFDRGNILGQKSIHIEHPIRIKDAIEKVSLLYAELLLEVINHFNKGDLAEVPQDERKASYSLWRDAEDYHIDWDRPAEEIQRFIYAVGHPYNGAITTVDGTTVTVCECEVIEDYNIINRIPGKLLMIRNGNPEVVCGSGMLRILKAYNETGELFEFKKLRCRLK